MCETQKVTNNGLKLISPHFLWPETKCTRALTDLTVGLRGLEMPGLKSGPWTLCQLKSQFRPIHLNSELSDISFYTSVSRDKTI